MWNIYEELKLDSQDIKNKKHRDAVGGMWEELGQLQYKWLLENGLNPEHVFLDVGCGSLRGGVHFIKYLNDGNYYGLDINQSLINAGKVELREKNIHKNIHLMANGNFEFNLFKQEFDFALAVSVFTHLPVNQISRCLINIDKVLNKGGKFYATFFETKDKFGLNSSNQNPIVTHMDKDPFHYHYSIFEYLVDGLSINVEYIGDWEHPRNQKMLCFYK